jgi:transformation/transcription domain-associated protein
MALVVETERNIHAASPTPFTPPLSAYLDRFPLDSLNILFEHIKEPRWVQTFRHVVQGKEAPHLVTELKTRGAQLAQAISGAEHANAVLPSILLCLDLAEADPEWTSSQEAILQALQLVWKSQFTEVTDDAGFNYSRLVLIRALYTIWIKVFKVFPRVDLLFNLSLIFTHPLEANYSEVLEFVSLYVANQTSLAFKRQAVQYFVTALDETSVAECHLVQYLRMVVIPLLTAEFRQAESPDDVLSDGLIVKMSEKIWAQHPSAEWSPAFASELLHMTGILVSNVYSRIGNETSKTTRGTVAKYIWDHLKLHEPPAVRNAASLAAARFLSNKEAASERFQNVLWALLLKVPQDGEPSPITRQALDIMLPVMVRAPAVDANNKWDVVINKTLQDEQGSMSTTVNIYRLIIRHADQCYPSRELFIPLLIPGLNRLGFQSASPAENRILAGDVIDLITNWLRRAAEEEKNEMVLDSATPSTRWVMPSNLKDAIVSYLIRYSVSTSDTYSKVGLTARHLTQLKTLFGLDDWKTVSVRIGTFARSFETVRA